MRRLSFRENKTLPKRHSGTTHTNDSKKRNNAIPHLLFLSTLLGSKEVLVLLDACRILKKGYSFIYFFAGVETTEINTDRFEKEIKIRDLNGMAFYVK